MDISRIYLRMQLDIFILFHRHELSQISETNRRFNAIIEKYFASMPYLVFSYVQYYDGKWVWTTNAPPNAEYEDLVAEASPIPKNQIAHLSTSKFVRFQKSEFVFNNTSAIGVLQAHKHLWNGGHLRIFIQQFLRSMDFAGIVNTCSQFLLRVPGSLRALSGILQGKCKQIYLIDKVSNPAKQLPIIDIVSFLFKNSDMDNSNSLETKLTINTRYPPKYDLYEEIVHSIMQKFLETSRPPLFKFAKYHNGDMNWPHACNFFLDHPHSNKRLNLKVLRHNQFKLSCSTKEENWIE